MALELPGWLQAPPSAEVSVAKKPTEPEGRNPNVRYAYPGLTKSKYPLGVYGVLEDIYGYDLRVFEEKYQNRNRQAILDYDEAVVLFNSLPE